MFLTHDGYAAHTDWGVQDCVREKPFIHSSTVASVLYCIGELEINKQYNNHIYSSFNVIWV